MPLHVSRLLFFPCLLLATCVLTFRPQYAHYLVSKLVELQVDIEEKDDIIEKKDDIIERLKAEIERLKRDNKQIIATVQEMTNCREESHAVSVTSEDNEAGDGEKDILCASLEDSLLFKEITNCVDEDEKVDHAVSFTEDNEEGNVQENVVCMSFADNSRYLELKMSNSPSLKDFTFVDKELAMCEKIKSLKHTLKEALKRMDDNDETVKRVAAKSAALAFALKEFQER